MDSGFQAMDSSLQLGLWIPISSGISEPLSWIFPNSKSQDSGYFHKQIFWGFWIPQEKICWVPESGFLTWGDIIHKAITYYSFSQTVFVMNGDESCSNKCMYEAVGKSYQFLFFSCFSICLKFLGFFESKPKVINQSLEFPKRSMSVVMFQ